MDSLNCRWEACAEEFSDGRRLTVHAQTHVLETMRCAYQDCTETFRWPRLLMENNVRHIEQRTALKPSTRPTVPQQLLPSPELGQNIPAWAVLAPAVRIPRIPKERRKTLRAWVTPPTQHLMHYLDAHVDHLSVPGAITRFIIYYYYYLRKEKTREFPVGEHKILLVS
ncbi:hypothetical protein B0H14DRAFT_2593883 [Mycena olivaceomarginata]|nr:hypothetical protein B0H14DRAFT_2593883 [Mycena olivaceomarginata]